LAIQVAEAVHSYAKYIGKLKVLPVYGGQSISQQIRHLRSGVQIVVGTPGRIMDHLRRETVNIADLKVMVLDEADEMLRMGFIEDVEWILSHTPETRQTALFSATMPRQIRRIADKHIKDAVHVEIQQKTLTVPAIKQFFINLPERQKTDALTRILEIQSIPGEAMLIFHRTKIGTEQLKDKLQARGYAAEAMHGDMNQNQRESVIKRMKNGKIEIVVATDVAARGLDVEHITTVVNYDMPSDSESYVHRIGRTGRAGREGKAILFVTPRQQRTLRDIERYTKQKIEPLRLPTDADVAARREERLKKQLTDTLKEQDLSVYTKLVNELADETGIDIADIAAAATFLSVGDKQLSVNTGTDPKQFSYSEEGMVRLLIDIGRRNRISPGDIVGAIANEADIPGKAIGAIDVNDGFTIVDIPAEFVEKVLSNMQGSRIRSQNMNIRLASSGEVKSAIEVPRRKSDPRRKGEQRQAVRAPSRKPKTKNRSKPKKKSDGTELNNPFFGNFAKRKKKKRK
ncbi:MAG: DEAD/DEAH box helicase, partial [Acidobacteria bacterium]|nr:DEAD/DEAH box helicase [Acidobacteriota bacterium]